ncbi:mRNA-decapping enzyme 1A isoform X1 [Anguilla anguilla]|uniref:mRNA-decapping enzyme 1A isoform X1 n=1 Tax=Anguilla anguilla TaxID=7936 RepID=UPI0015A8B3B6|nr:mRNA-decapping enzyme 1A isoform X1 [Anguilla anguilla]
MEAISKTGHHMSLAALQQHDPYINRIVDVTGQVALYTFNSKANEWEKTDIEGTLFVYTRSASPYHGFTIMNRLNMKNLVEPINKDLEFQLQDPFLLYRNSNLAIYSIWFYDKSDCQRIAQLMARVVKQEALQAQQAPPDRSTPSRTNGCVDERPIDILELLSKAKEEYQRVRPGPTQQPSAHLSHSTAPFTSQTGEPEASTNPEPSHNPEPLQAAGDATAERGGGLPQHDKSSHSGLKQITVEELFGSSVPKEPAAVGLPGQSGSEKGPAEGFLLGHSAAPPFPFEPSLLPRLNTDPGGDRSADRHLAPALVPLPDVKGVSGYALHPSPVFHAPPASPLLAGQPGAESQAPPAQAPRCPPNGPSYGAQNLLSQLQPDTLPPPAALAKPALAPNFLPAQLATPESFKEPIKPAAYSALPPAPIQMVPLKAGPAVSRAEPSVLLSPSVFQHSVTKTPELDRKPAPPSPSSLAGTEPPSPFNRLQLQDTLIHLIKNDSSFLNAIHEAYLQSLSKDLNNMKL